MECEIVYKLLRFAPKVKLGPFEWNISQLIRESLDCDENDDFKTKTKIENSLSEQTYIVRCNKDIHGNYECEIKPVRRIKTSQIPL